MKCAVCPPKKHSSSESHALIPENACSPAAASSPAPCCTPDKTIPSASPNRFFLPGIVPGTIPATPSRSASPVCARYPANRRERILPWKFDVLVGVDHILRLHARRRGIQCKAARCILSVAVVHADQLIPGILFCKGRLQPPVLFPVVVAADDRYLIFHIFSSDRETPGTIW